MAGTVTVILPCRNVGDFVRDSLNSLIGSANEIRAAVCVDDGSTDDTINILHRAAGELPFDVTVLEAGGAGAGAARNLGLANVDTAFCQFLDADDLLLPGKLAHQLGIARDKEAEVVTSSYMLRPQETADRQIEVVDDTWSGLLTSRLGCTSSMLFRTEAVRAVDGWAESLGSSQEYELLFRMVKSGARTTSDNKPLTVKLERGDAISSGEPGPRLQRFIELRSQMLSHLKSNGMLTPQLRAEGLNTIFRSIQRIRDTDRNLAETMFDLHLPEGYIPSGSTLPAKAYGSAFRILGFRRSEALRCMLDGVQK